MSANPQAAPQISCVLVPVEWVPSEWPAAMKLLQPAVERSKGRWNMGALLAALCQGRQQLWLAFDDEKLYGAMTTQIMEYPGCKMVAAHFLGGEQFDLWCDRLLDVLEEFAKNHDCKGVEATARHGFWPFFKRRGYGRAYTVYDCEFGEAS